MVLYIFNKLEMKKEGPEELDLQPVPRHMKQEMAEQEEPLGRALELDHDESESSREEGVNSFDRDVRPSGDWDVEASPTKRVIDSESRRPIPSGDADTSQDAVDVSLKRVVETTPKKTVGHSTRGDEEKSEPGDPDSSRGAKSESTPDKTSSSARKALVEPSNGENECTKNEEDPASLGATQDRSETDPKDLGKKVEPENAPDLPKKKKEEQPPEVKASRAAKENSANGFSCLPKFWKSSFAGITVREIMVLACFILGVVLWFTRDPKFIPGWGPLFNVSKLTNITEKQEAYPTALVNLTVSNNASLDGLTSAENVTFQGKHSQTDWSSHFYFLSIGSTVNLIKNVSIYQQ